MTNKTAMSCLLLAVALGSLSGCGGGDSAQSPVVTPDAGQIENGSQPGTDLPATDNTDTDTVVGLEVPNKNISVVFGQQGQQAKVVAVLGNGTRKDVTAEVTWESSNPEVANIKDSATGELAIKQEGSAVLTATYEGLTVDVNVTVAPAQVTALVLEPSKTTAAMGHSITFHVEGVFTDKKQRDVTDLVTLRAEDTSVVEVTENGLIAKEVGSTLVYAELDGVESKPVKIDVTDAIIEKLSISPERLKMIVGTEKSISATGTFSDGSTQDLTQDVEWHSESSDVVVLSQRLIQAKSVGNYKVYATIDGIDSNRIDIEVVAASLEKVEVKEKSLTLAKGNEQTLQAMAYYNNGLQEDASDKAVWTTSDTSVAVFNGATLTAVAPGKATLFATLNDKSSSAITLEVTDAMLEEIVISPSDVTMNEYNIKRFKAIGNYSDNTSRDITNQVTWTSSNKQVVEPIGGGVSSSSTKGEAKITASYNGKEASTSVTVTDQEVGERSIAVCDDSMTYAASQEQDKLCLKTAHNGDNRLFTAPPTVDLLQKLGYKYVHGLSPEAAYGTKYSGYFVGDGVLAEKDVVYAEFNQVGVDRAGLLGQYARWCEDLNTMKFAGRDNWQRATMYDMFSLYSHVGGNIYDGTDHDGKKIDGVNPIGWPVMRMYGTASDGHKEYIGSEYYNSVNMRVGSTLGLVDHFTAPTPVSCVSYNNYVPLPEVKR